MWFSIEISFYCYEKKLFFGRSFLLWKETHSISDRIVFENSIVFLCITLFYCPVTKSKERTIKWKKTLKRIMSKPPVRIELTTPGLQDQCSNHWAMEADDNDDSIEFWKKCKRYKNQFVLSSTSKDIYAHLWRVLSDLLVINSNILWKDSMKT